MRSSHSAVLLLWVAVVCCGAAPAPKSEPALAVAVAGAEAKAEVAPPAAETGPTASRRLGGMDMSMQMTFFGGHTFDLWFEAFHVHNAGTLTAACLGIALMAILYEGLKVSRIMCANKFDSSSFTSMGHWVQVFLHIVQVTCGYFLMLATMTYSSYLMISLCAGAGVGYAIFGRMVSTKALLGTAGEHCH